MNLLAAKTWSVALLCLLVVACGGSGSIQRTDSTPAESAASYNLQLGVAYMQQGNLALAQEKLERSLQQNPRDPGVHSALALLSEKLGRSAEADRYFRSARRLAPADPDIGNNYAVYLCRTRRVDEGVERFIEVARNPLYRSPEAAYTNAGVCLRGDGRIDDAAGYFARALAIRPDHAEATFQLGDLDLERGLLVEGRLLVDRFLAANKATPDLLLLGARLARAQGDRLAEERYGRRLRLEFPDAAQLRQLPGAASRNKG
jgi:type IV pilus assembly protein PilF